ncbi:hypothetical protein ACB092_12G114300 [Castanea dentata]
MVSFLTASGKNQSLLWSCRAAARGVCYNLSEGVNARGVCYNISKSVTGRIWPLFISGIFRCKEAMFLINKSSRHDNGVISLSYRISFLLRVTSYHIGSMILCANKFQKNAWYLDLNSLLC